MFHTGAKVLAEFLPYFGYINLIIVVKLVDYIILTKIIFFIISVNLNTVARLGQKLN